MRTSTILQSLYRTIALWEKELDHYSLQQLYLQPGKDSWSPGQVYIHLLDNTLYYNIPQIEQCISNNKNTNREKSDEGKEVFARNGFPDKKLKAPPSKGSNLVRPESIEQLRNGLQQAKTIIGALEPKIASSSYKGKTKHPGFGYLDAWEWIQFIEIHFRHHLRQKDRIDLYLKAIKEK